MDLSPDQQIGDSQGAGQDAGRRGGGRRPAGRSAAATWSITTRSRAPSSGCVRPVLARTPGRGCPGALASSAAASSASSSRWRACMASRSGSLITYRIATAFSSATSAATRARDHQVGGVAAQRAVPVASRVASVAASDEPADQLAGQPLERDVGPAAARDAGPAHGPHDRQRRAGARPPRRARPGPRRSSGRRRGPARRARPRDASAARSIRPARIAVLDVVHRVRDVVGPVHDLRLQAAPPGGGAVAHPREDRGVVGVGAELALVPPRGPTGTCTRRPGGPGQVQPAAGRPSAPAG